MIPIAEPIIGKEELKKVVEAVKSGWVSSRGKFIAEFENTFAKYCGVKYGVSTCNGTTALHLALAALNIGKGDEVLVPALTFISTANVVAYTGAKPVFVDSTENYWQIDPDKIEEKITKRTKAVIPVHLYGHPCDMGGIMRIAGKHKLHVIEDCAEAHGAEYNGKKVGSFGIISCFSFYGNKIITTGEGGMCLTNNSAVSARMNMLKGHGMNPSKKYWHDEIGFNYRMTNLQAAIGVAQLAKIDKFIEGKRRLAGLYGKYLGDLAEKGFITLHPEMPWAKCVYWMYSILIENKYGKKRNNVIEALLKEGIDTRPFFYPVHTMPCYRSDNVSFPGAERVSSKGINLPSAVNLTDKKIKYICDAIIKYSN